MNNAKDFGAVGDGAKDDSEALQKAIDASSYLYIPTGTYLVTKSLRLHSNLVLRIHGTLVRPNGFNNVLYEGSMFQCRFSRQSNADGSPIFRYNGITILGDGIGILDGNCRNHPPDWRKTPVTSTAFLIENTNGITIDGLLIREFGLSAVHLIACSGRFSNNEIDSFNGANEPDRQGQNQDGLHLSNCHLFHVEQNRIHTADDPVAVESGYASVNGTSRHIWISRNVLTHSYPGTFSAWARSVYVYAKTKPASEIFVTDNAIKSDGFGLYGYNAEFLKIRGNTMVGGRVYDPFQITEVGCDGTSFSFTTQGHSLKLNDLFRVSGCGEPFDTNLPLKAAPSGSTIFTMLANHRSFVELRRVHGEGRKLMFADGLRLELCKNASVSNNYLEGVRFPSSFKDCESLENHSNAESKRQ